MEVSRLDIRFDEIEESKNFIKFPIKPYLDLLNIKPVPSQIAIINSVNRYKFTTAAVSRRQGKTFMANIIGQLVALVPDSAVLIMAPNYGLAQISFELQRKLLNHFSIELNRDNAKDRILELVNGSTIRMGSINQVDSCVGRSYDLIIFDEAAIEPDAESAFEVSLRPTLDKPGSSHAIFISTPRGKNNWFARFWHRGFDEEYESWASVRATYLDNPRENIKNIQEAMKSMSKAHFLQEYMCDFSIFEGQIWNFNSEKCVARLDELDIKGDVIAGLDVGFRDPTAFVIIIYDWDSGKFYIVDEYLAAEKTTEEHAREIQKLIERWDPDFIFMDSAAQQVRFDLAQNYDITTTNAEKDVLAGIGHVGSLVENDLVVVDERCTEVLFSFDQYRWDPNPNLIKEKPIHDKSCHMADAIRYALYSYKTSSPIY